MDDATQTSRTVRVDGRRFAGVPDSTGEEVGSGAVFADHEEGGTVRADYGGGAVRKGVPAVPGGRAAVGVRAGRHRSELVVLDDDASGRVDLMHLQRELGPGGRRRPRGPHARAHGRRARPAGGRGGPAPPGRGGDVRPGRVPVRRPAAPGRRRARLRHPGRHRGPAPGEPGDERGGPTGAGPRTTPSAWGPRRSGPGRPLWPASWPHGSPGWRRFPGRADAARPGNRDVLRGALPAERVTARPAARTINVSTAALTPPDTGSVLAPEGPPRRCGRPCTASPPSTRWTAWCGRFAEHRPGRTGGRPGTLTGNRQAIRVVPRRRTS